MSFYLSFPAVAVGALVVLLGYATWSVLSWKRK